MLGIFPSIAAFMTSIAALLPIGEPYVWTLAAALLALSAYRLSLRAKRGTWVLSQCVGGELKEDVLKAICAVYGCGDPDPVWGGYQEVWFKQFAVDFDKIEWRNKKAVGGANGISDGVGGMQEDELLLLQVARARAQFGRRAILERAILGRAILRRARL